VEIGSIAYRGTCDAVGCSRSEREYGFRGAGPLFIRESGLDLHHAHLVGADPATAVFDGARMDYGVSFGLAGFAMERTAVQLPSAAALPCWAGYDKRSHVERV
jgi:hypothetical protein